MTDGRIDFPRVSAGRRALRIVLFLITYIAVQFAGTATLFGIRAMVSPGYLESPAIGTLPALDLFSIVVLASIPGIAVTLFFWRRVDGRPLADLLAWRPGYAGLIGRAALAAVILITLASLPALLVNRSGIRLLPAGPAVYLLDLPAYALVFSLVALNEELSFRGYLLRNLLGAARPGVAVVITAVVFAALHLGNPNLSPTGYLNLHLAGAFLALSYLRWRTLWYPVAFHFTWNIFQAVVLALPVSGIRVTGLIDVPVGGPAWLTGGSFGPEGSLVTTILLGAACLGTMAGTKGRAKGRAKASGAGPAGPAGEGDNNTCR